MATSKLGLSGFARPAGIPISGTLNVTEPADIALFTGIVGIVAGGDGVMWRIMQDIMFPVPYAIMQSDENDS